MLTLRQIEVIRAIMVTGTVAGAAKLLNVSAPGLSRLMKYTETSLGLRLFDRRNGRFVPTAQAHGIFEQVNRVFQKVEDLRYMIAAWRPEPFRNCGSGRSRALPTSWSRVRSSGCDTAIQI